MHSLIQDVRYGVRLLFKNPGFSGVAVLVLALGIGANTAVFSLVNAMMLRPIASTESDVVGIFNRDTTKPDSYRSFSFDELRRMREGREVFADVMAHTFTMVGTSPPPLDGAASDGDNTRRSFAAIVSAGYFSTLNVRLAAGRPFSEEEARPGSDIPVVIVGHEYARRMHIPPADVLGRSVRINARDYTIVGVAPEGFAGTMALVSPELWVPTGVYARVSSEIVREGRGGDLADPANHVLMLVGRLRPGLTATSAEPLVAALSGRMGQADPAGLRDRAIVVQKLPRLSVSDRPHTDTGTAAVSLLLLGTAAIVLLIACLNLANMLLARGAARRREIALRLAIGAGRGRIVRQLLTESLLIAIAGGAAGLLLAIGATRLLVSTLVPVLPLVLTFDGRPDIRVLGATLGFSVLSTIVAGLWPAWRMTRPGLLADLKEQSNEAGGGRRRLSMRNLLVVGQVALSLALLTAAGLFMRGAVKAAAADPGFPLDGVIANVSPSLAGYDEARGRTVLRTILQRVRSTPGVRTASVASTVPFGDISEGRLVQKAGAPPAAAGQRPDGVEAAYRIVGADYFEALRLPVVRGRSFTPAEEDATLAANGMRIAIVDEVLARRLFADADPIGQRVQYAEAGRPPMVLEVVGLVGGIRDDMLDKAPGPHVYVPFGQNYRGDMTIHARLGATGHAAEAAMLGTLRREIRAVDANVPVTALKTLRQHRDAGIMLWIVGAGARLFAVFGGVALLLAVVGVYGVKSYLVSRRTREIGIRMALGATRSSVLWLVLREGMAVTLSGVGIGLLLSWGIGRLVSGLLYEVSPLDPLVFAIAPLVLTLAALIASYIPARRATAVAPLAALRSE